MTTRDATARTEMRRPPAPAPDGEDSPAGSAHVATCSFLASRAVPTGGFFVALAGGVALARAAARHGWRWGYGTSAAATLEATAILGPARFGVPLTQAITAPIVGRLDSGGASPLSQMLVCAAIRLVENAVFTAFYIWILVGGLDAYAGAYDALFWWIPWLPEGAGGALRFTAAVLVGWSAFASAVQVLAYRRGLRRWPATGAAVAAGHDVPTPAGAAGAELPARGFDPRALGLAAVIAFALLLSGTAWPLLAAAAAWLCVACLAAPPAREALPAGVALAAIIGAGVLAIGLVSGVALDLTMRRTARALLLVGVATWLRGAAGADGLREVFRRVLDRLRRVPAAGESAFVLDRLGSTAHVVASGRALLDALRAAPKRPAGIVDTVLDWVAREARWFTGGAPTALDVRVRARDVAMVALASASVAVALAV